MSSLRDFLDHAWIGWLVSLAFLITLHLAGRSRHRVGLWQPGDDGVWRSRSGAEGVLFALLLMTLPLAIWPVAPRQGVGALAYALICAVPCVLFGFLACLNGWDNDIDLSRRVLTIRSGVRFGGWLPPRDPPREIPLAGLVVRLGLQHRSSGRNPRQMSFLDVSLVSRDGEPHLVGQVQAWSLSPDAPWRTIRGEPKAHRWLEETARAFGVPDGDATRLVQEPRVPAAPSAASGLQAEARGDETWLWLAPSGLRGRPVAVVRPSKEILFARAGASGRLSGAVSCPGPILEIAVKPRVQPPRDGGGTELVVRSARRVVRCLPTASVSDQAWLGDSLRRLWDGRGLPEPPPDEAGDAVEILGAEAEFRGEYAGNVELILRIGSRVTPESLVARVRLRLPGEDLSPIGTGDAGRGFRAIFHSPRVTGPGTAEVLLDGRVQGRVRF